MSTGRRYDKVGLLSRGEVLVSIKVQASLDLVKMLCDLNIEFPVSNFNEQITKEQLAELKSTLNVAEQLGYTHIALNFRPIAATSKSNKIKLPNDLNLLNPINIDRDFSEYRTRLKLFSRITVKIDDPTQCQYVSKFQQIFDIVALEPITEKSFQSAISNLEIDLISFNLQERLPCFMKHKTLCSAIDKGMMFEIKYTDFLSNRNRAQVISNAKQIIRASRNRGMICSSGCSVDKPFQLRNYNNAIPLLKMLGIDSNRCNMMFQDWSLKVLLNGRLRIKSYKQTIVVAGDENLVDNSLENKDWTSNPEKVNNVKQSIQTYKKRRPETALDRALKKQKN